MPDCWAKGCKSRNNNSRKNKIQLQWEQSHNQKITFHRMPKNPEERKKWLERMGLSNEDVPENAKLCSLHFEESAFDRRDDYYIRIRPGVIPFGNASVSNIEAPKKKQKVLDTRNQENIVPKTIVQDNSDCHFIETVQNNSDIPGTVTIDSIIISTSSTSEVIDAVSQLSTPRKVKHQGTAVSPRLSEDTPRKQTLRIALINTRKHYNKKIKSLRQKHRKFVKCNRKQCKYKATI